jgi:hypothetical protein
LKFFVFQEQFADVDELDTGPFEVVDDRLIRLPVKLRHDLHGLARGKYQD